MSSNIFPLVGMLICIAIAGVSVWHAKVISDNAKLEIEQANKEADDAIVRWHEAIVENERLARTIAAINTASEAQANAVQQANEQNQARVDGISKAPDDWSDCKLPDCVRNAFGGRGQGSSDNTPSEPHAGAMQ